MSAPYALSLDERARRYAALRAEMADAEIDVLLVVGLDGAGTRADFRYVSGYSTVVPSREYVVLPRDENREPTNLSRVRQRTPAALDTGWVTQQEFGWWGLPEKVVETIDRHRSDGKVGVARFETIGVPLYRTLVDRFGEDGVVDAGPIFDGVRFAKSPEEIDCAREAARIADAAYEHLRDVVRVGATDYELFGEARRVMHTKGAEYSFDIVATDRSGGYAPIGLTVGPDSFIGGELTPVSRGYYNQIRFEFRFGDAAKRRARARNVLREAYATGVAATKPGATGAEVYAATAAVIERAGYESGPGHAGHSMGLSVLDGVEIDPTEERPLQPNTFFAFHPKIVPEDGETLFLGGTILVTETGSEELNRVDLFSD